MASEAHSFLTSIATELRRENAAISRMDSALVERDIAVRRREAALGRRWAGVRSRIRKELERLGVSEAGWCREELGCDIRTMRRRVQLAKGWVQYERARRHAGNNGQFGLVYGLSLIPKPVGPATKGHRLSFRSAKGAGQLDLSRCQFVIGDALTELRKLRSASVNVVICSPPYWPLKRWYGGHGIGFEPTVSSYITNLVAVFREVRRVLKKDGVLWVVIGDSYASDGGKWRQDAYKVNRPQKQLVPVGTWYPGSDLAAGNLMMVPARLALALQDDGWLLRQEIIWDKGWVRPESARDRVTRTHDTVYMLCKNKHYFYDQDPIRDPLISSGGQKPDAVDRDTRTDFRVYNNPLGRNSGSVWRINSSNYRGAHTATFPPELVRRMIECSCDDDSLVMDVFGGAGTTALVALQLGHRAITIDINPAYTDEARARMANAPSRFSETQDDPDQATSMSAGYASNMAVAAE